jgi:hypothetical protein
MSAVFVLRVSALLRASLRKSAILLHEVRDRQSRNAGVFRAAFSVGQMAEAARAH